MDAAPEGTTTTMDPNENLREQRRLVRRILDTDDLSSKAGLAVRLAELVEALDEWISRGGFLPAAGGGN